MLQPSFRSPARLLVVPQPHGEMVKSFGGNRGSLVAPESREHGKPAAPDQDAGDLLVKIAPSSDRFQVLVALTTGHLGNGGVGDRGRVLEHGPGDLGIGIVGESAKGARRAIDKRGQLLCHLSPQDRATLFEELPEL